MALNFNPPPRVPRAIDKFSSSLDSIFEAYQNAKNQGLVERDRQGQALLQYGFDPRQVTPDILRQAQMPAPGTPTNPNVPPGAFGSGSPELPAQEHPLAGAVRSFLDKKRQASEMASQTQKAELGKTLSETDENFAQAEALRNRPKPGQGNVNTVNIKGVDYIEIQNPNGTKHYQPIPVREPTQSENAARQYADSATQAHNALLGLEQSGYEPSQVGNALQNVLPTAAQSKEFQSLDQSRRQFINAILRRESGAAISASEYDNYTRQYFPVPGDSKEVRAQKAEARALKIRGLASEGKRVESQLSPSAPKKVGRFEVTEG